MSSTKHGTVFLFFFILSIAWDATLPSVDAQSRLRLATTTSVENSRLLEYLLPSFTSATGIQVDVIAVGTGAALKLGQNGDVDIVLVHAPDQENRFIQDGYGLDRRTFMQNDFLIVGPASDPAQVQGASTVQEAFVRIARSKSPFVSRGDSSGTHIKEQAIWKEGHIKPEGSWYKEAGQGMEAVLRMASDLQAYTLTDSSTWTFLKEKLSLKELYRNREEPILQNLYSIILVNPEKNPKVKFHLAKIFHQWITSPQVLRWIDSYRINGEQLFWTRGKP